MSCPKCGDERVSADEHGSWELPVGEFAAIRHGEEIYSRRHVTDLAFCPWCGCDLHHPEKTVDLVSVYAQAMIVSVPEALGKATTEVVRRELGINAPPLAWTREKPSNPGLYWLLAIPLDWYGLVPEGEPELVEVVRCEDVLSFYYFGVDDDIPIAEGRDTWFWWGPITVEKPAPPKENA